MSGVITEPYGVTSEASSTQRRPRGARSGHDTSTYAGEHPPLLGPRRGDLRQQARPRHPSRRRARSVDRSARALPSAASGRCGSLTSVAGPAPSHSCSQSWGTTSLASTCPLRCSPSPRVRLPRRVSRSTSARATRRDRPSTQDRSTPSSAATCSGLCRTRTLAVRSWRDALVPGGIAVAVDGFWWRSGPVNSLRNSLKRSHVRMRDGEHPYAQGRRSSLPLARVTSLEPARHVFETGGLVAVESEPLEVLDRVERKTMPLRVRLTTTWRRYAVWGTAPA